MNDARRMQRNEKPDAVRVKVFLGYSDAAHERLGKKYCMQIAGELCPFAQPVITEWNFETLANAAMNVAAADEARNAWLAVFAVNESESLPQGAKMWFERWCATKSSTAGFLVVVLSEAAQRSRSTWTDYSYLEAQTRAYGIHLFVYASDLRLEEDRAARLATARTTTFDTPFRGNKHTRMPEPVRSPSSAIPR
jgi:hypothetical protein